MAIIQRKVHFRRCGSPELCPRARVLLSQDARVFLNLLNYRCDSCDKTRFHASHITAGASKFWRAILHRKVNVFATKITSRDQIRGAQKCVAIFVIIVRLLSNLTRLELDFPFKLAHNIIFLRNGNPISKATD